MLVLGHGRAGGVAVRQVRRRVGECIGLGLERLGRASSQCGPSVVVIVARVGLDGLSLDLS